MLSPILFVDLFRQASYKNMLLLSFMNQQRTYFSCKYSKYTNITLNDTDFEHVCEEDDCENYNDEDFENRCEYYHNEEYSYDSDDSNDYYKNNNNKIDFSHLYKKDNIKAIKGLNLMQYHHDKYKYEYNDFVFRNIKFGNIKIIRYLLNNGQNMNIERRYIKDTSKDYEILPQIYCNMLSYSAIMNRINITKLLLDKGADIHYKNDQAFRYCASYGCERMINMLICDTSESIRKDYLQIIKYLLDNGADIHAKDDDALIGCINAGIVKVHGNLFDGRDNSSTCDIDTKLRKVVKLLLDNGANVHARNNAAFFLSYKNFKKINCHDNDLSSLFDLLIEYGANTRANNDKLLRLSAKYDDIKLMKDLFRNGADINVLIFYKMTSKVRKFIKENLINYFLELEKETSKSYDHSIQQAHQYIHSMIAQQELYAQELRAQGFVPALQSNLYQRNRNNLHQI